MRNNILVGDALAKLRLLPSKSVHSIITSPPYWNLRDYQHSDQIGIEASPQAYIEKITEVFMECFRVLRDDGTLWLNLADSYGKGKQLQLIPFRVAQALQEKGWILRQDIIWAKNKVSPESVKDRCTKSHEYIFLFSKKKSYFFDFEAIREVSETMNRNRRSVWNINPGQFSGNHFAAFPEKLVVPMILASTSSEGVCDLCGAPMIRKTKKVKLSEPTEQMLRSGSSLDGKYNGVSKGDPKQSKAQNPSDLKRRILESMSYRKEFYWIPSCEHIFTPSQAVVLDPFFGTGTVGDVAQKLGRQYIGIELNPDTANLAHQRLSQSNLLLKAV